MKKRKSADLKMRTSNLEMRKFEPIKTAQETAVVAWADGDNLMLSGCAGTGKTYVALCLALGSIKDYKNGALIVRSAVPSRDVGFMPGDNKEKGALYELPYEDMFEEIFGRGDAYQVATAAGIVNFTTTSYLRGVTFRDAVVIIEEFQNMSMQELDTIITRIGEGSRVIVTGDFNQSDLTRDEERRGAGKFYDIVDEMNSFSIIEFTTEDVVRSGLVKEYLEAKERLTPGGQCR